MKNTDTSGNKIQNAAQRTTQNATKCMTQSSFQKKILNLVQRAGDKVAEAMNLVDEAGAIAGINVHFERGGRSKLTERNEQGRWKQQDEWSDHRAKHPKHLDGDLCNRYGRNNYVDASDIFYEANEVNEADAHAENYEADEFDEADEASYFDEIKEVTIPELAEMISERTCFRPECTLCVLNTAFELMDERNLMLDLGTFHADTEKGAEDSDTSERTEERTGGNN